MQRAKAPVIRLTPHKRRVLETILYLLGEAARRRVALTQYDIVKSAFIADRTHVNRFGRPITFDNYYAMEHGPVPSYLYDLLKNESLVRNDFSLRELPWDKNKGNGKAYLFSNPKRAYDPDVLSESDIEALSAALTVVSKLQFSQIRRLTHEDPAYVDAWEDNGDADAYPMSYGLLFEVPNFQRAEELAFASEHV